MDLLTQGLLGAALAQTRARKEEFRHAALIGGLAGLLADADVLIRSSTDPLLTLEFHRHFTHSIFFIPFGALIATLLLWPFLKNGLSFARIYGYALLGYSLSGFIDACTSYGTYLFWPFYDGRIALGIISIVDPVFTLVLLFAVFLALRLKRRAVAVTGLLFCALYLILGLTQSQRVETLARGLAEQRGHEIEKIFVKPTLGNLLLWRSSYIAAGAIHVDAIRAGLGGATYYYGSSAPLVDVPRDLAGLRPDSLQLHDVHRFIEWSDGYVSFDARTNVLGDLRYSLLPNSVSPLWGLRLNLTDQGAHARYEIFREVSAEQRRRFTSMLLGKALPEGNGNRH